MTTTRLEHLSWFAIARKVRRSNRISVVYSLGEYATPMFYRRSRTHNWHATLLGLQFTSDELARYILWNVTAERFFAVACDSVTEHGFVRRNGVGEHR